MKTKIQKNQEVKEVVKEIVLPEVKAEATVDDAKRMLSEWAKTGMNLITQYKAIIYPYTGTGIKDNVMALGYLQKRPNAETFLAILSGSSKTKGGKSAEEKDYSVI